MSFNIPSSFADICIQVVRNLNQDNMHTYQLSLCIFKESNMNDRAVSTVCYL
jgi:hypothetical protein